MLQEYCLLGDESKQLLMLDILSQIERDMGWIILFLHTSAPSYSHEYLQVAKTTYNSQE